MTWNHNADKAQTLAAADTLEHELATLPGIDVNDRTSHETRRPALSRLEQRLRSEGLPKSKGKPTTCVSDWKGARFALFGFRATSTSGLDGAIRNWIAQVRAKADAA